MKSGHFALGVLLFVSVAAAQQYVISTYAGGGPSEVAAPGLSVGIGGARLSRRTRLETCFSQAQLSTRCSLLDPKGVLTRVAGNSQAGFSGDGGPATTAALGNPSSVAVDGAGNLFIADQRYRLIRKVSASGIIATVAGNGSPDAGGPLSSTAGPATDAHMSVPSGLAVDGTGNLYIADPALDTVRKVSVSGIISTIRASGCLVSRVTVGQPQGRN